MSDLFLNGHLIWQVVLDHTDKPGVRDRQNFNLHWSVDYWQNFTLPPAIEGNDDAPIPSRYALRATPASCAKLLGRAAAFEHGARHVSMEATAVASEHCFSFCREILGRVVAVEHGVRHVSMQAAAMSTVSWLLKLAHKTGYCLCRLQAIGRTLTDAANSAGIFSSSKAAAYWSYHITRSGFFAIQGIAGWPHYIILITTC